ncbi:DUF4198 domain-containing protein [Sphingomonas sp. ID0503]|uniref:DUF4198 domain-containing protein n=1 Tax=Sphingomonas sp. ID0503 TaxID=3399691 RepID=UPI003AFB092D
MKTLALASLLAAMPMMAQAHEVWVERDGAGPARIYLGEPAKTLPAGGDPEFEKLKAPKLVPASSASQTRKAGFIEVAAPAGDVRVTDDSVFEPWGEDGKMEAVIYYARAGRADARIAMPLEIAPTAANGGSFALMKDGKPVPSAKITVITPDKWSKAFTADASGTVAPKLSEKGRYILTATHEETGDLAYKGGKVAKLYHIATTTFVNE